MQPISFKRHRFPPDVIQHAVWLNFRFTLSLHDVEELKAQPTRLPSKRGQLGRHSSTLLVFLLASRPNS
jgi:hypothetical protein